jgi:hypothetical protein
MLAPGIPTIRRYIAACFQRDAKLKRLVVRETDDGMELSNSVEIVISTNSFRATGGRRIVCAVFDEVAFFRSDSGAAPDSELYTAIKPSPGAHARSYSHRH